MLDMYANSNAVMVFKLVILLGQGGKNEPLESSPKWELQWNLSKADTYGTKVFVRFGEVSALERFELKSSQI